MLATWPMRAHRAHASLTLLKSTIDTSSRLLLISSERGQIYSFATPKLQPILVNENSKQVHALAFRSLPTLLLLHTPNDQRASLRYSSTRAPLLSPFPRGDRISPCLRAPTLGWPPHAGFLLLLLARFHLFCALNAL